MRTGWNLGVCLLITLFLSGCYKEVVEITAADDDNTGVDRSSLEDWTEQTHSNDASPDYDIVFNNSEVNRLDIVISADDWQDMQDDLDDVQSSGGSGPGSFSEETPMYVPCQVYHNDIQWYDVGIRYKGNSSLATTYRNNNGKKPLRLEFDEFEDDNEAIKNQRFYGFKELSLSNNFDDGSLMREKMACELYRDFGVPAPHAAYYEIYVDYGEGATYFGVYTIVEVVFNTMLEKQFGSETGNCYKPDGDGAKFSSNGFTTEDFGKKTNKESSTWADIEALYDILQSGNRTSNTSQWMTDLEAVFDVNGYLKWLAANTTMQNWDTYGRMTHNYYLYHDPADDLIKWIPWDNNEALQEGKMGGGLSFEFSEVSASEWPLIGYIVEVDDYKEIFDGHVKDFSENIFEPSRMEGIYNADESLLSASASAEQSGYTFLSGGSISSAVNTLITHCSSRKTAVDSYLE